MYLVTTPEISTNWLYDELIIYDILFSRKKIIMDISDYKSRYTLSKQSPLDFLNFELLRLLKNAKLIVLIDYKKYYKEKEIKNNLQEIDKLLKKNKSSVLTDEIIEKGYNAYLEETYKKEPVKRFGNKNDKLIIEQKINETKKVLHIGISNFESLKKESYKKRLLSKLVASRTIINNLKKENQYKNKVFEVFDGEQYILPNNLINNYNSFQNIKMYQ